MYTSFGLMTVGVAGGLYYTVSLSKALHPLPLLTLGVLVNEDWPTYRQFLPSLIRRKRNCVRQE